MTIKSKNTRVGKGQEEIVHSCLPKYNNGSGAGWSARRDKKKKGGNQTAGSVKSENCQADAMERYFAKSSRSYKHRDYESWVRKTWKTGYDCMSYTQFKEMQNEN